jgi:diguanylate cyclase (GGDEF)-like protein
VSVASLRWPVAGNGAPGVQDSNVKRGPIPIPLPWLARDRDDEQPAANGHTPLGEKPQTSRNGQSIPLSGPRRRLDLLPLIRELEHARSGLAYVYWCLDHLTTQLALTDAVLVSDHPGLGRQVFCGRGRAFSDPDRVDWWAGPGLYVQPEVVSEPDARAISALCHIALSIELARHDAAHDALTGLLNRRSFDDALAALLSNATRYGTQFSLVLLDVDGLKHLNDTAGHWEGDRLLQAAGSELRRSLRAGDFAARLGGDEFGLLLVSSVRDAAQRLRDRVSEAVSATLGRDASFSVGVAAAPGESTDASGLYRLADTRLYEDKRKVRRCA